MNFVTVEVYTGNLDISKYGYKILYNKYWSSTYRTYFTYLIIFHIIVQRLKIVQYHTVGKYQHYTYTQVGVGVVLASLRTYSKVVYEF